MDYEKLSKEELIEALKESQDLNKKLLDLMEIQNNKFTEISIKALEEQIKSRHNFLAELEQSEPPKLFKFFRPEFLFYFYDKNSTLTAHFINKISKNKAKKYKLKTSLTKT